MFDRLGAVQRQRSAEARQSLLLVLAFGCSTAGSSEAPYTSDAAAASPRIAVVEQTGRTAAGPTRHYVAGGTFEPGEEHPEIEGHAVIVRHPDGTTVSLQINGLPAATALTAQVLALPCAADRDSYLVSLWGEDVFGTLELRADEQGEVSAVLQLVGHTLRPDAVAVDLGAHASGYASWACADVSSGDGDRWRAEGDLAAVRRLPGDREVDPIALQGRVEWQRDEGEGRSRLRMEAEGFPDEPGQQARWFHVDLARAPCDQLAGNGEPVPSPAEAFMPIAGRAQLDVQWDVALDEGVQAAVVRRGLPDAEWPDGTASACADLVRDEYPALVYTAELSRLSGAIGAGALDARAQLTREVASTRLSFELRSARPGSYVARLHDRPCAIRGGGAPYVLDPEAPDGTLAVELSAQGDGSATAEILHPEAVRADARSIVLLRDGMALACGDLTGD